MKVLLLRCENCYSAFVLKTGEEKKIDLGGTTACKVCRQGTVHLIGEVEVLPKNT
jgi:hypothetical protein